VRHALYLTHRLIAGYSDWQAERTTPGFTVKPGRS